MIVLVIIIAVSHPAPIPVGSSSENQSCGMITEMARALIAYQCIILQITLVA